MVLLGVSIAGTWLYEAFGLGIIPYLRALLVAGLAVVMTVLLVGYLARRGR